MRIPISKIGPLQKVDIEKSGRPHDDYARVCRVINSKNWHGDLAPCRMATLLGKNNWRLFDTHFVVQVAGCPLKCSYCYVDNLKPNKYFTAGALVKLFAQYKEKTPKLNVFHLMGGCPARYPDFWQELRENLDDANLEQTILFSDVIFLEHYFYGVEPWKYLQTINNFFLVGCLKGTTKNNFLVNTGTELYDVALSEMEKYLQFSNFWVTLIEWDPFGVQDILRMVNYNQIDWLTVVEYEPLKYRKRRHQK